MMMTAPLSRRVMARVRYDAVPGDDAPEARSWTFASVTNARAVVDAARAGTLDACVLDGRSVVGARALDMACYRARVAIDRGEGVARGAHAEIILGLSHSRNVGEAFRRFGGGETSETLVIVAFEDANGGDRGIEARVMELVEGRLTSFDDRGAIDEASIKTWFKIGDAELALGGSLEDAVLSRMAIRDVA